jgi:small subunit ribosomal protein S16
MAVKMRLRREGKRKQPFYRVVVADVRSPRDGRFIDDLGYYQPLKDPSEISIDHERALHWLRNGVQPSDAVLKLLRIEGIWEEFKPGDPGKDRSAGHQAGAKSRADAERADAQQAGDQTAEAQDPTEEADAETVAQAREEVAQPDTDYPDGETPGSDASAEPENGASAAPGDGTDGQEEATS